MHWNMLADLTLASALFGAVGSILMFFGSYAFEPYRSSFWGTPEVAKFDQEVTQRNRVRHLRQRAGIICLLIAFVLQAGTVYWM